MTANKTQAAPGASQESQPSLKEKTARKARKGMQEASEFPYLIKTIVTYTRMNAAGREQKEKRDVVFELDVNSAKMPWYVLRNYLVPNWLTEELGPKEVAWQRVYEIKIIKMLKKDNPGDISGIPLRIMTYDQLEEYCRRWQLGVPVREFYSVEKAREMVKLRQDDEKGYQKHLADYREGKQRSYPELDKVRGAGKAQTVDPEEFDAYEKKEKKGVTPPDSEMPKGMKGRPAKTGNPFGGM